MTTQENIMNIKFIFTVFIFAVSGVLAGDPAVSAPVPVTVKGSPAAAVSTGGGYAAHLQIRWAATELTNWIARISGAALPVDQDQNNPGTSIILGTPETSKEIAAFAGRHKEDFDKIGDTDGFVICTEKGKGGMSVFIAAPKTKGVLNGVYRFLERNTDIIWARQFHGDTGCGTVYGKNPDVANVIGHLVDVPAVKYRWWTGIGDERQNIWQARLLNNTHVIWNGKPAEMTNRTDDCTVLYKFFTPGLMNSPKEKDHRKTDPDIYPLIDGERKMGNDPQLCFGNPKSARLFAQRVIEELRTAPKSLKRVLIALGDNSYTCCCTDWCLKPIMLPDGTQIDHTHPKFRSTQFALFVNQVSEIVRREITWIDPLSVQYYIFTSEPPLIEPVGKEGQYCPYVKNHKRPVFDDGANPKWHAQVEGFKKIGAPVAHVYEYYLCRSCALFPHAICEVAQKDLLYYGDSLRAFYNDVPFNDNEQSENDSNRWRAAYDASAIEFWVLSRLMWDPHTDVKAARREYCRRAYREAGDIMAAYHEKLSEIYNADSAACLWNDDPYIQMKYYIVDKGLSGWLRDTLAKAESAAVHPCSKELIQRHRAHMMELLDKAETMPDKIELAVPQLDGAPDSLDPESAWWKAAAKIGPLTAIKNAAVNRDGNATMLVAHDLRRLYLLCEVRGKKMREFYDKAAARGQLHEKANQERPFDWGQFEFFLDGKLRNAGSYFYCPVNADGRKLSAVGSAPDASKQPLKNWTARVEPVEGGLRVLVSWDLDELGVEITKDPKIGAMFMVNDFYMDNGGASWNGGYWHAPTAFQTLRLEMK